MFCRRLAVLLTIELHDVMGTLAVPNISYCICQSGVFAHAPVCVCVCELAKYLCAVLALVMQRLLYYLVVNDVF